MRVFVVSAGLVVLAAAGFYLAADVRDRHGTIATHPVEVPPEKEETLVHDPGPAATVSSPGDLILDALPWGRVVAIVGPDGQEEDLGESLFTPVRLSLPAGSYRVILENPAVEQPANFWVQVSPSVVRTKVYEFEPIDADAYFEKTW